MKEPQITAKIVAELNSVHDCYAKKRHSGKFGGGGEPDISGCFRGTAFYIETKMLEGAVTPLQAAALEKWRSSGAKTFVAIYDPKSKELKIISLDSSESWSDFPGNSGIRELWETSVSQKNTFSKFDFYAFCREDI